MFYHLTYEGAVNIDNIRDPQEKAAIIAQIKEFGQTMVRDGHFYEVVYGNSTQSSLRSAGAVTEKYPAVITEALHREDHEGHGP